MLCYTRAKVIWRQDLGFKVSSKRPRRSLTHQRSNPQPLVYKGSSFLPHSLGIEPTTPGLQGEQLLTSLTGDRTHDPWFTRGAASYLTHQGSNPRPLVYKGSSFLPHSPGIEPTTPGLQGEQLLTSLTRDRTHDPWFTRGAASYLTHRGSNPQPLVYKGSSFLPHSPGIEPTTPGLQGEQLLTSLTGDRTHDPWFTRGAASYLTHRGPNPRPLVYKGSSFLPHSTGIKPTTPGLQGEQLLTSLTGDRTHNPWFTRGAASYLTHQGSNPQLLVYKGSSFLPHSPGTEPTTPGLQGEQLLTSLTRDPIHDPWFTREAASYLTQRGSNPRPLVYKGSSFLPHLPGIEPTTPGLQGEQLLTSLTGDQTHDPWFTRGAASYLTHQGSNPQPLVYKGSSFLPHSPGIGPTTPGLQGEQLLTSLTGDRTHDPWFTRGAASYLTHQGSNPRPLVYKGSSFLPHSTGIKPTTPGLQGEQLLTSLTGDQTHDPWFTRGAASYLTHQGSNPRPLVYKGSSFLPHRGSNSRPLVYKGSSFLPHSPGIEPTTPGLQGEQLLTSLTGDRTHNPWFTRGAASYLTHRGSNSRPLVYKGSSFLTTIMLTCPCNEDPLIPNFYIVKLGFTGVYIIFLFLL